MTIDKILRGEHPKNIKKVILTMDGPATYYRAGYEQSTLFPNVRDVTYYYDHPTEGIISRERALILRQELVDNTMNTYRQLLCARNQYFLYKDNNEPPFPWWRGGKKPH